MADALISPAVGATMWAISGGVMARSAKQVKALRDDRLVPMMGVLGAFVFTAQMINFSLPGTGSSGHLGGGLLLAILLGPHAAFLVISSVLAVQSLFFADGGLLALGCNIFNMGFIPAFVAYPLIYRPMAGAGATKRPPWGAALVASIAGLQMGALGVVLETKLSGITSLSWGTFALLMQSIHLAIGTVEGIATAALIGFLASARPESLLLAGQIEKGARNRPMRPVLMALLGLAVLTGGVFSWFASKRPDGLEWAIAKISGKTELPEPVGGWHQAVAQIQKKTAILPDYDFKKTAASRQPPLENSPWPGASLGTSISGILGGMIVLVFSALFGFALRRGGVHPLPEKPEP